MGVGGGTGDLAYQHALAMMYSQTHWDWAMEVNISNHSNICTSSPIYFQPKMQLENGEGIGGYGRPQSSTSLSPPASGLVVPQPINPRLPNNMIGGLGMTGRKYPCKMCPQVSHPRCYLSLSLSPVAISDLTQTSAPPSPLTLSPEPLTMS